MQVRLTFRLPFLGQLLPFSYQYELSSWIYHVIGESNSAFASFLHDQGYVYGNRRFKFFTFSHLYIPHYEPLGDRMKILRDSSLFHSRFLPQRT